MYISAEAGIINVRQADSFLKRFRGLMLKADMPADEAMLIAPCSSIHMMWMLFSIDAVFIDRNYRVLKVVKGLRPWIGLAVCPGAWAALELKAGAADFYVIKKDSVLEIHQ